MEQSENNKEQKTIDIAQMICGMTDNLRTQFEILSQVPHDGERGRQLEKVICQVIEPLLSRKFGIGTGHIIGPSPFDGKAQSLQCDIVIYNAYDSAPLFVGGDYKIFWHESVEMVIEVKSTLKCELQKAIDNIQAVKRLVNTNSSKSPYGVIFAYKSGWSPKTPVKTIQRNLKRITTGLDEKKIPDTIFVLDAGQRGAWEEHTNYESKYGDDDFDDRLSLQFDLSSEKSYRPIVANRGALFWFIRTILSRLNLSKPIEHFPREFCLNIIEFIEWENK